MHEDDTPTQRDEATGNRIPRVELPQLTDEQAQEFVRLVFETGRARLASLGKEASSVDFVAGAMVTLEVMGAWGKLPASWVFGPFAGRDPITGKPFEQTRRGRAGRVG